MQNRPRPAPALEGGFAVATAAQPRTPAGNRTERAQRGCASTSLVATTETPVPAMSTASTSPARTGKLTVSEAMARATSFTRSRSAGDRLPQTTRLEGAGRTRTP